MNYKNYVKILIQNEKKEKNFDIFFANFIKFLEKKGEINLLPKILKDLKKEDECEKKENKTKLFLKDKKDLEKYKEKINSFAKNFDLENMEILEEQNIVGGFVLKNKKNKVDASYRKKLKSIYEKIVA